MSRRKLVMIGAVLVAAAGAALALPATHLLSPPPGGPPKGRPGPDAVPSARESGPVAVTTAEAVSRPVQRTVGVVGTLSGREEVSVSTKTDGRIIRVRRDVGDEVKPGEVLIELDPTDVNLAVTEAERALELELTKLGLKDQPPAGFDITTLPSLVRAAAKESLTEAKYKRLVTVSNSGSREEVAQAEFDYHDAREAHRQARLDAATILATVRQRQAGLDTARRRQADTRVVAPAATAGEATTYLVAQRTVSEGEMVRIGSGGLIRLVLADTLKLQAAVPERYLGEVKVGQRVEVAVEAFPRERFAATVARVNPTVDRSSRTLQIECTVPNPYRRLAAGCFAKAEVLTQLDPNAVLVPEEALVQFAGVTKVFVVRDGKVAAVAVRAGDARVDAGEPGRPRFLAEVGGGVKAGDRVVVTGHSKLTDGAAVRVRGEPAREGQP
ncbi:efflux RND transporter periplasmic adaptor subunit [bacterium]|nr:efflux RND transporter periplasmic adaptor subunit [bacterium]